MRFKNTVIFVTGGAGFIGSARMRHLLDETDACSVNIDKLTYAANLDSIPLLSSAVIPGTRSDRRCLVERSGFCAMPSGCDHLLLVHRHCIKGCLHRRFGEAPALLMWALHSRFHPSRSVCNLSIERYTVLRNATR